MDREVSVYLLHANTSAYLAKKTAITLEQMGNDPHELPLRNSHSIS